MEEKKNAGPKKIYNNRMLKDILHAKMLERVGLTKTNTNRNDHEPVRTTWDASTSMVGPSKTRYTNG